MTPERWQPVLGYESRYEVSDLGRVRSMPRVNGHMPGGAERTHRGGILTPFGTGRGYLAVGLRIGDGTKLNRVIHRLVLEAFVGPRPPGKDCCRHLDGDMFNNALANLAWGTDAENVADTLRHGHHVGANQTHCKHGHEFTPDNTGRDSKGNRRCRACNSRRSSERELRKRAS